MSVVEEEAVEIAGQVVVALHVAAATRGGVDLLEAAERVP
jgi:hypothetical protein